MSRTLACLVHCCEYIGIFSDRLLVKYTAHSAGKPLFGICFGHQIIAFALGGKVGAVPPMNFTLDSIDLHPSAVAALRLDQGTTRLGLYKCHGCQV